MRVTLELIGGSMDGKTFDFAEPDVFIFGRARDCQCCISEDDNMVSRHHFLLEVNPPECQIRDLGSLNGTYVNGVKYGGREKGEEPDPEKAAKNALPVELRNGDIVNVGQTRIRVTVQSEKAEASPAVCVRCGHQIPMEKRDALAYIAGTYLCQECRRAVAPPEEKRIAGAAPGEIKGAEGRRLDKQAGREKDGAELLDQLIDAVGRKSGGNMPQIPGYSFVRELGRGAFGKVYLVTRQRDNKEMALKIMLANKRDVSQKDIQLFQRETENCMKLRHPNIVALEEQGHVNGMFYFVMEFCPGGSMSDLMTKRGGHLELEEALPLMLQALDGLAYIHSEGFVHRDLKPNNILLDKSKTAKISDLGLAKNFASAGLSGFTRQGSFAGTAPFMPAEQVTNYRYVQPTTDVFSMGATFYNMLTGDCVYDFPRGVEPLRVVLEQKIVPIGQRKRNIPKKVATVIDKAISAKPTDRYPTATEMKRALEEAV